MESKLELLLVDRDEQARILCSRLARGLDCELVAVTTKQAACAAVAAGGVAVALIDVATVREYRDLMRNIKQLAGRIEVLIADEHPSIPRAIAAIKSGAADYLEKPFRPEALDAALEQALRTYREFEPTVIPLEQIERNAIEHALEQANGNRVEAARLLDIGKTTLYRKLREYEQAHRESNDG